MSDSNSDTADGDKCAKCGEQKEHPRDNYCGPCGAEIAATAELAHQKRRKPNVDKVVSVYCKCQSETEIDVQGLERGESVKCGRCGSKEIVYTELGE